MPQEDFRVVPMEEAHIKELAHLETLCFSEPWSEEALKAELDNPHAVFLVAVFGNQVVGYVGCQDIMGEGYISNVAVFPLYRKSGVAKALLAALCAYGEREGLIFLTLEVRVSNRPAISLYEKFGFTEQGRRPRFYRHPVEDALIMTRFFSKETETV